MIPFARVICHSTRFNHRFTHTWFEWKGDDRAPVLIDRCLVELKESQIWGSPYVDDSDHLIEWPKRLDWFPWPVRLQATDPCGMTGVYLRCDGWHRIPWLCGKFRYALRDGVARLIGYTNRLRRGKMAI